jgi:hypothetical protein
MSPSVGATTFGGRSVSTYAVPYSQNGEFDAVMTMADEASDTRMVGERSAARSASESVARRPCQQTLASNLRQTTVAAIENVRDWKVVKGTVVDVQSPYDPLRMRAGTLCFVVYHPEPLKPMKARLVVVVRMAHYWVHCGLPMPPDGANEPALNIAVQSTSLRSAVLLEGSSDYVHASDFQDEYDAVCPDGPVAHVGDKDPEGADVVRAKVRAENLARRQGQLPASRPPSRLVAAGSTAAQPPAAAASKAQMERRPPKKPADLEDAEP